MPAVVWLGTCSRRISHQCHAAPIIDEIIKDSGMLARRIGKLHIPLGHSGKHHEFTFLLNKTRTGKINQTAFVI